MPTPKILALAGSLRKDSFNKKLAKLAADAARSAGAEVTLVDLADFPMPVYNGDDEAATGLPENAKKLKQLFVDHQALLLASPEYNSSVSGAFKNAIDWISRPDPKPAFSGKVAAIMSCSPGALGGLRGLVHLRAILSNVDVLVLPIQLTINTAHEAFNPDGSLKDPKKADQLKSLVAKLAHTAAKLHA